MATKPSSVLITDRTIADVTNRTEKGFNNFSDVKRVQDWINYLIDEVSETHESHEFFKTTWSRNERVDQSKWDVAVLGNIRELLKSYPEIFSKFQVPSAVAWNYQKQNTIEKILLEMSKTQPTIYPVSFATDDWSVINNAAYTGAAQDVYKIGDTRKEMLEDGTIVTLKLRGFSGLTETTGNATNMTISLADNSNEEYKMFEKSTFDISSGDKVPYYSNSLMAQTTLKGIYNNFSQKLKNVVKKVKFSMQIDYMNGTEDHEDYLFLPSYRYSNGADINIEETSKQIWLRDYIRGTLSTADYKMDFFTNRKSEDLYQLKGASSLYPIQWFFCL